MDSDDNITVIDLSAYGAANSTYTIGSGTDTITLDSSMITAGSITSPYIFNTGSGGYSYSTTGTGIWGATDNTVHINADGLTMKEGADIKIGGKSLSEAIDKIEQRLAILNPNPELESRWKQLQELREQYVEMERDLLEKEKLMRILKET